MALDSELAGILRTRVDSLIADAKDLGVLEYTIESRIARDKQLAGFIGENSIQGEGFILGRGRYVDDTVFHVEYCVMGGEDISFYANVRYSTGRPWRWCTVTLSALPEEFESPPFVDLLYGLRDVIAAPEEHRDSFPRKKP